MTDSHEQPVDASDPDSPIAVRGTDHITVEGTNTEDTIEFWRDLLGMPLVLSQPNLDRRHLTHLFFDTGDGRMLTFFVNEERESTDVTEPDPGQVHHLAFRIDDGADFVESEHMREAFEQLGLDVDETDVGDAPTGHDV